jgi:hypothetical protein
VSVAAAARGPRHRRPSAARVHGAGDGGCVPGSTDGGVHGRQRSPPTTGMISCVLQIHSDVAGVSVHERRQTNGIRV